MGQFSQEGACFLPTWRILARPVMTADPEACKVLVASAMGEAVQAKATHLAAEH